MPRAVAASVVVGLFVAGLSAGTGAAGAAGGKGPPYRLYFGDLHAHTNYSDAWTGTPWDSFAQAKACGADFFATTDHDSYGYWISPEEWADTLAAAEFYTSGKFVAMAGYEFWLASSGEINVYNTRNFPPVPRDPDQRPVPGSMGSPEEILSAFYDWLASEPGAVGQWNHPTYVTNNFHDFDFRTDERDVGMGVIEIWNWKYTEDSYILALDQGWHVMPSANSDTHSPDWICGWDVRTVLLAPRLTPADLYDAMRASRGYATLDRNLRIVYTLNGAIMGSVLKPEGSSYVATIQIEDPDRVPADEITLVEIVSDGGTVVARVPVRGTSVDLTIPLTSETARYFYVRVSTASVDVDSVASTVGKGDPGITAWTSPVWTGR